MTNVNINQATTGTLTPIATDTVGGVDYPQSKVGFGGTGTFTQVQNSEPLPVKVVPYTSGGPTNSRVISAGSTNATNVKNSAGQVYGIDVSNTNASARYLKLYDKASAPTVGSDTPIGTYLLKAGELTQLRFPQGKTFASGIGFALTTGVADADTGAVSANEHVVNMEYK